MREFHSDLYAQSAIAETVQAYGELLQVTLDKTEDHTRAKFEHDGDDLDFYVDAFCNHVLFLTIQQFRDGAGT